MKKLEELGISPWPWNVDDSKYGDKNDVVCNYVCDTFIKGEVRTKVVAHTNHHFDSSEADACFIAAAPDLYECLREAVEEMCHMTCEDTMDKCTKPESVCFVSKWRKALAKASGESEVK